MFTKSPATAIFHQPPHLQISTSPTLLEKKLDAIGAFRSQRQIQAEIDIIKKAGPVEYIRDLHFGLYNPQIYEDMFKEQRPPQPIGCHLF